jgi:periplasmic protein TonB
MRATLIAVCLALIAVATSAAQDRPSTGVTLPTPTKQVKPGYTTAAMDAGIQGTVLVEILVRADGTVGEARVERSLDMEYGLDQQAIEAARQWEFKPGTRDGKPADVSVQLEFRFTLK